jgi:glycosyltransferase involved in cell wall biosynthesis
VAPSECSIGMAPNDSQPLPRAAGRGDDPVYQGGESLAACLESVQAQSHRNWVHLVVDNASTDDTRRIDESYAASDARVTVLSFGELLPMLENFNRALTALPAGARYFKQLNADDTLHTGLSAIHGLGAERDPGVALVVSRFYIGSV